MVDVGETCREKLRVPIFQYELNCEIVALQNKWSPIEMNVWVTQGRPHQGKFKQTTFISSVNLIKKVT